MLRLTNTTNEKDNKLKPSMAESSQTECSIMLTQPDHLSTNTSIAEQATTQLKDAIDKIEEKEALS